MERYLLFDSGCALCTDIAKEVEKETRGWLTARSLRDPKVKALLDQTLPGWRWGPMVLEVSGSKAKTYAGLGMGVYLVLGLGPGRAFRLAKLVSRTSARIQDVDPARRRFLWQSGLGFAALGVLLGWPQSKLLRKQVAATEPSQHAMQAASQGELYEGFVLLPEDAPQPDFIQCAGTPILGDVTDPNDLASLGETVPFGSVEDLRKYIPFSTYIPAVLPPNIHFTNAEVIQYAQSGDIFLASINFGTPDQSSLISVWAQPEYPRPYPVWPGQMPNGQENIPLPPEKVAFSPKPGLMRRSAPGHVLHWIKEDILYTLVIEHSSNRGEAIKIAKSLVQI